jgi:hypothetical protein
MMTGESVLHLSIGSPKRKGNIAHVNIPLDKKWRIMILYVYMYTKDEGGVEHLNSICVYVHMVCSQKKKYLKIKGTILNTELLQ